MARVTCSVASRARRKKILKQAKGYYGARSRLFRVAKQAVIKACQYAYRDRRKKKREFRSLWIVRIGAATKKYGLTYSRFIYGLSLANINIDRKLLAYEAVHNEDSFAKLVDLAKSAIKDENQASVGVDS